jgi:hypothetical protein
MITDRLFAPLLIPSLTTRFQAIALFIFISGLRFAP